MSGLVTLAAAGIRSRDEILGYFAELYRGKLERKWAQVWDALVSSSCELYPGELMPDIQKAFEDDLVDKGYIGMEDVRRDLALGKEAAFARLRENPHHRVIQDTVAEMSWWACFQAEPKGKASKPEKALELAEYARVTAPIVRTAPKVGRNDPCPRGSGKKYKKCIAGARNRETWPRPKQANATRGSVPRCRKSDDR